MTALSRIRLELGRTTEFPEGSTAHGYEFIAPLHADGHIDAAAWKTAKAHCGVRRFWGKDNEERGMLAHVGHGWRFDYRNPEEGAEPFFKADQHSFVPGNYVSIREHDGITRPFRVADVTPI